MNKVDKIELSITCGNMSAPQVFTQMKQLIKAEMTPERAREILEDFGWGDIEGHIGGHQSVSVDGVLTAFQLEAIACLMREQQDNG